MKIRHYISLLLFAWYAMPVCAQNKLYIISEKATLPDLVSLCDNIYPYNEGSNIYLNYAYTYPNGEYSVTNSLLPIALKIDCDVKYDSCPRGTNCGGSLCCQEEYGQNLLNYDLNLFNEILINDGATVSCNGFASADPELQYYALLVPHINQIQRNTAPCSTEALFERYNGQVKTLNNMSWQYLNRSNQWVETPNYQHQYPLIASVEAIFGTNYRNYFNGNLQLRYKVSTTFSNTSFLSAIVTFSISPCTPGIAFVSEIATRCSNSSNGGFTITFNRPLETGEQLNFNLRKGSPSGPLYNKSLQTFSGTNYTWPDPLAAGDYYLSYQSNPNGSVVNHGLITIPSATPVTFSANWTPVDCFGDNTGSISMTADGGKPNYKYSIDNGANWAPFSGVSTHIRSNLPAGTYSVKIKDANNCVAQQ